MNVKFTCAALLLSLFCLQSKANEIVDIVNINNAKIRSIESDVKITLKRPILTLQSTGKLFFEKNKNFRMQTTLRNGQQGADIGSNKDYFWFWIKRIDARTMHYSSYSNLMKTNLPDSLHPLWMMDLLGVNHIKTENTKIKNQRNYITVQLPVQISPRGTSVVKIIMIDPNRPAIVGIRLYSTRSGSLLSSSDVISFFKTNTGEYFPQQTKIWWKAEQVLITWTLVNPKINTQIDARVFQMPKTNLSKIDIGRQNVRFK